jgi:hypothetical protein
MSHFSTVLPDLWKESFLLHYFQDNVENRLISVRATRYAGQQPVGGGFFRYSPVADGVMHSPGRSLK